MYYVEFKVRSNRPYVIMLLQGGHIPQKPGTPDIIKMVGDFLVCFKESGFPFYQVYRISGNIVMTITDELQSFLSEITRL